MFRRQRCAVPLIFTRRYVVCRRCCYDAGAIRQRDAATFTNVMMLLVMRVAEAQCRQRALRHAPRYRARCARCVDAMLLMLRFASDGYADADAYAAAADA